MASGRDSDDTLLTGMQHNNHHRRSRPSRHDNGQSSPPLSRSSADGTRQGSAHSPATGRRTRRRPSNLARTVSTDDREDEETSVQRRPLPAVSTQHHSSNASHHHGNVTSGLLASHDADDPPEQTDMTAHCTAGETTAGLGVAGGSEGGAGARDAPGGIDGACGDQLEDGDDGQHRPIMEIVVHSTSTLKSNAKLSHPVVRVTVVDTDTGQLYPKLHPHRPAVSFYETKERDCTVVLPMQTQPFSLRENRTLAPKWQESLFVNEDMSYFTEASNVLLLFEVMDFHPTQKVKSPKWGFLPKPRRGGVDAGWHCVAWAFLKLQSGSGHSNTGQRLRLQLYKVPKIFNFQHTPNQSPQVFRWWASSSRVPYSAQLTVTVRECSIPSQAAPGEHEEHGKQLRLPFQEEVASVSFEQLNQETRERITNFSLLASQLQESSAKWSRLPGQACRVPNKESLRLSVGSEGCSAVKFSHCGRLLAAGCARSDLYGVMLFEIPGGFPRGQFLAHHNIVYDLSWSSNDQWVASASSDGTVRCWNIASAANVHSTVLPHPAFVYAAQYHPSDVSMIVTGGFDKLVRSWLVSDTPQLCQELDGHHGMINSLCFDNKGSQLFSGDSLGVVMIWSSTGDEGQPWARLKTLQDPATQGVAINSLSLSPGGVGLLVHTRDSCIRLMHCHTGRLLGKFSGLINWKERICSAMSPCGGLVFSGSEDGEVYVWNTANGLLLQRFSGLPLTAPAVCIDYHPHEHMAALSTHSANNPVLVYTLDTSLPTLPVAEYTKAVARPATDYASLVETQRLPAQSLPLARSGGSAVARQPRTMPSIPVLTIQDSTLEPQATPNPPVLMMPEVDSSLGSTRPTAKSSLPSIHQPMSFVDVAVNTVRLKKLADKLDSVLQDNNFASSTTQHSPKKRQGGSPETKKVKAQLAVWQQRAGVQQPSSRASSTLAPPQSQSRMSTASPGSVFTWNTIWEDSTVPQTAESLSGTNGHAADWKAAEAIVSAAYDYDAAKESELTFCEGDAMTVLHKENKYWWYAEASDGRRGYIPVNYLDEQDQAVGREPSTASRRSSSVRPTLQSDGSTVSTVSLDSRNKPKRLKSRFRRRSSAQPSSEGGTV